MKLRRNEVNEVEAQLSRIYTKSQPEIDFMYCLIPLIDRREFLPLSMRWSPIGCLLFIVTYVASIRIHQDNATVSQTS